MKIDIVDNLVTIRYKDHKRYKNDVEENKDTIDNTIEYDNEWVINILI